ncbi:hypothetical protein CPC08DRAFT_703542 [Agrocybe pediades]|nr:hypothetical protein CPC08DRAFT_703542 [Agrocybe pediades]
MPSYFSPPASPTAGFFPSGQSSPQSFNGYYQRPRDNYSAYSTYSSGRKGPLGSPYAQGGKGGLKRLLGL